MPLTPIQRWHNCLRNHDTHGERKTMMWKNLLAFVRKKFGEQWGHRWVIDTRELDQSFAPPEHWRRCEWHEDGWRQTARGGYPGPDRDHGLHILIDNDFWHEAQFMWRDSFKQRSDTGSRERLVLFATDALTMLDYLERDERERAR